jgi:hypothetical protein
VRSPTSRHAAHTHAAHMHAAHARRTHAGHTHARRTHATHTTHPTHTRRTRAPHTHAAHTRHTARLAAYPDLAHTHSPPLAHLTRGDSPTLCAGPRHSLEPYQQALCASHVSGLPAAGAVALHWLGHCRRVPRLAPLVGARARTLRKVGRTRWDVHDAALRPAPECRRAQAECCGGNVGDVFRCRGGVALHGEGDVGLFGQRWRGPRHLPELGGPSVLAAVEGGYRSVAACGDAWRLAVLLLRHRPHRRHHLPHRRGDATPAVMPSRRHAITPSEGAHALSLSHARVLRLGR